MANWSSGLSHTPTRPELCGDCTARKTERGEATAATSSRVQSGIAAKKDDGSRDATGTSGRGCTPIFILLRLLSTINAFYLPRCSLPACTSRPHRTHVGESSMREIADLDTGCSSRPSLISCSDVSDLNTANVKASVQSPCGNRILHSELNEVSSRFCRRPSMYPEAPWVVTGLNKTIHRDVSFF